MESYSLYLSSLPQSPWPTIGKRLLQMAQFGSDQHFYYLLIMGIHFSPYFF